MQDTLVFIDEGFLSRLSKHLGNGCYLKFDITELARNLAKKEGLFVKHIFYATAPPFQGTPPTEEERKRKEGYDKFKSKLSALKDFTFLEGRVQKLRDKDGAIVYKQKGVDTVLTMALSFLLADYPSIRKIILVACDTDFVPVIKMLSERGIEIILYSYYEKKRNTNFSRSHHLIDVCSKYTKLTKEDFINSPLKKR